MKLTFENIIFVFLTRVKIKFARIGPEVQKFTFFLGSPSISSLLVATQFASLIKLIQSSHELVSILEVRKAEKICWNFLRGVQMEVY